MRLQSLSSVRAESARRKYFRLTQIRETARQAPQGTSERIVSAPDGNCPENAAFHAKERIYRLAWMFYVSIVSGVGALTVIGMVVGCAQIVVAFVAGKKGADGSEAQEDIQAKLPLLAARCVALGIGMGILSLLPGHNIDSDRAIWLLGLAVVLLAISRIAEMGNKAGS